VSPKLDVTRLARRVVPPGELRCICAALQAMTTTDASDRYYSKAPYTMCRRASNNTPYIAMPCNGCDATSKNASPTSNAVC